MLAVDDSPDVLFATRRALRRAGINVITANSISEAEAAWAIGRPNLVLLDVNLRDGNGIETCNRWKADADRRSVPIILRSAVSVSAAQQALGLVGGADGYLTEPVDAEVLVATVQAHLRIIQLANHIDLAVTAAGIGSMLWNGIDRTLLWRSTIEILQTGDGHPPATLSQLLHCVHHEDLELMSHLLRRIEFNDLDQVNQGFGVRRIDGSLGHLRLVGQAVRNYPSDIVGFSAIVVDMSEPTGYSMDTERLVHFSIELASVETSLDVQHLLDSAGQSLLDAADIQLLWSADRGQHFERHIWSREGGAGGASDVDRRAGDLTDLLDDARAADNGNHSASQFISVIEAFVGTRFVPSAVQRSWAVLPFHVAGAFGTLVIAFRETQRFDEGRQRFLRTFTNMAALALAQTASLARQRNIADTLQQALLPEPELLPELALDRWLIVAEGSGTLVGGDWFDGYVVDDDHQIIVVGDVVGHGTDAASYSAAFRHTLRTLVLCGFPVSTVLHRLDALISRESLGPSGTLLILEIELSTNTLTLTSAGHPPPIVIDQNGASRIIDVEPNTLLGFGLAPAIALSTRVQLQDGDIIVAFTDGLIEQRRVSYDDGYRRLADALDGATGPGDAVGRANTVARARVDKGDDAMFIAVQRRRDAAAQGTRATGWGASLIEPAAGTTNGATANAVRRAISGERRSNRVDLDGVVFSVDHSDQQQ